MKLGKGLKLRLTVNPLLADPSSVGHCAVILILFNYNNSLMLRVFFLNFLITAFSNSSMFPKWERWQVPAHIIQYDASVLQSQNNTPQ